MITILQQFYRALVSTMTACRQKATVQEEAVASLTEQLRVITVERDLLVVEQEEAIILLDEMTEELDKK
jgi:heat shock protein HslJ